MIRDFQIAAMSDPRPQTPDSRLRSYVFGLVSSVLLSFCVIGCVGPKEEPIWEKVKIGDLAPRNGGKPPQARLLKTINFDVHIFEMPAENISKLDDIRSGLRADYPGHLRFYNRHAFSANSFSACFGQIATWNRIGDLLLAIGGQKIAHVSLLLTDGVPESIVITGLDGPRTIFFTPIGIGVSREGANVGPGILALRIRAEKIPAFRGVCNVNACPVFSPPITVSAIPQLAARAQLREFLFHSAAFGVNMSPGDFVLLGPEKYIEDQTALGGLFFSKPEGSLFLNRMERKPPERKPAVRVFLLVCTGINY